MKPRSAGFTLMEVLAVIFVIGIIAAVFGSRYVDRNDQAKAGMVVTFLGGQIPSALMTFAEMRGKIDNVSKADLTATGVSANTHWGVAWTVEADTVLTDNRIQIHYTVGAADTATTRSLANEVLLRLQNATDFPNIVAVARNNNQLDVTYQGS